MHATIQAFGGKDTIYNKGTGVTINAGSGNDSIRAEGTNSAIYGDDGDDTIENWYGSSVTIEGGKGDDTIRNGGGYNVTSSGGAGNDSIYNYGYDDKILGGAGDDSISLDSSSANELILYKAGDGNDVIDGFKADSTLSINGGIYGTTTKSGSDVIVTVGEGKITLLGAATLKTVNIIETPVNINNDDSDATLYGTNADDKITNTGENVAIFGLGGKDSLDNNAAQASIDGGLGDDKITNTGKRSTLTGQSGSDTIQNNADKVLAVGGAGHDSIFNHGEGVTISGGAGNDIIENDTNSHKVLIEGGAGDDSIRSESAHNVTITSGDGNDLIQGFKEDSTLQIASNKFSTVINGDDVIVTVGDSKITIRMQFHSLIILRQASRLPKVRK